MRPTPSTQSFSFGLVGAPFTAELGNAEAHYKLGLMYHQGRGVEKDKWKNLYHMEEAAVRGHPNARYHLGSRELENGNTERARKHWIITATLGCDHSIAMLMEMFKVGFVSKEDLASVLRAHQPAIDATKSPQRDTAEDFRQFQKEGGSR